MSHGEDKLVAPRFEGVSIRKKHMNSRLVLIALALAASTLSMGCSQDGKYAVSGKVTLDGEPIPKGHVTFAPVDASLAQDAGPIENGSFSFRASAGEKKVEIFADRPVGKPDPVMNVQARQQYIPARYNEKTELTADVEPGGNNEFVFELSSQPGGK